MIPIRSILLLSLVSLLFLCGFPRGAHAESLSIIAPRELLAAPVTKTAIDDVVALLRRGFPASRVSLNDRSARVQLVLPRIASPEVIAPAARARRFASLPYPDQAYTWRSMSRNGRVILTLDARSCQGVAFALYGLLQERLGYRFYHPRRTLIPTRTRWPMPDRFSWQAMPRFAKRGFHLHTLHPVELTEQLHDPAFPNALADAKEYIDWLVRNQQNLLQFFLLRGIDRERWIGHAREIVAYAHRRGVLVGVEVSLSMLQQRAFQAVRLLWPFPSYSSQVDTALAWLFRADWDFVTLESTMGEYLPDLARLMPGVTAYFVDTVEEKYRTKCFRATHVIRAADSRERETPDGPADGSAPAGILIHTVMCYSATEPQAPVYGNRNQRFMLERARREAGRRETWYWPESAYWVCFDNSVPLLLLPYLDARWHDMDSMERLGVAGHLTFTSGWEWGYWLTDWSVARWSWRYRLNGRVECPDQFSTLGDLFPGSIGALWREALRLQNDFLKERGLIRYLAAMTPFSEMPRTVRRPFQPEPEFSYRWLAHEASAAEVEQVLQGPVREMEEYAAKMEALTGRLDAELARLFPDARGTHAELKGLGEELDRGLRVTALRARHRALTIRAIVAGRDDHGAAGTPEWFLTEAARVRSQARYLVQLQEAQYRYSPALLARKRESLTAYRFGYLYPVSDLFFWRREEEQARRDRFDPFFMNLWDFWRTVGLGSLL